MDEVFGEGSAVDDGLLHELHSFLLLFPKVL